MVSFREKIVVKYLTILRKYNYDKEFNKIYALNPNIDSSILGIDSQELKDVILKKETLENMQYQRTLLDTKKMN